MPLPPPISSVSPSLQTSNSSNQPSPPLLSSSDMPEARTEQVKVEEAEHIAAQYLAELSALTDNLPATLLAYGLHDVTWTAL
ncbi:unnamed protein product [Protopolystoma xenopodis]|uniref:Uncharacterized protein n=1 Tax=Protopolystoma xenopodis TaxID=117903 RepID=A0A3S5AK63_9PLAT|nr:unnamed protein product [Protopolystoma xenopodis]